MIITDTESTALTFHLAYNSIFPFKFLVNVDVVPVRGNIVPSSYVDVVYHPTNSNPVLEGSLISIDSVALYVTVEGFSLLLTPPFKK